MSDSNYIELSYAPEATWGTQDAAQNLKVCRLTSESFKYDRKVTTSKEIRSDRAEIDSTVTGGGVTGGFQFELSYGEFDSLLEAVFFGGWSSDVLINGTTKKYFTFQKRMTDIGTPPIIKYLGCRPSRMTLNIPAAGMVTGGFEFIGKSAAIATAHGAAGYTEAGTTDVLNASANVGSIKENDVAVTALIKTISVDINNNLAGREGVGVQGYASVRTGLFQCSGKLEIDFTSSALYTKFLNNTASSLEFKITDGATNSYTFLFPKIKFETDPGPQATGQSADVVESIGWRAFYDSVAGCVAQVTRDPA